MERPADGDGGGVAGADPGELRHAIPERDLITGPFLGGLSKDYFHAIHQQTTE